MKLLASALLLFMTIAAPGQGPAGQRPTGLSFTATLDSIKISGRPGQVVTRQFRLTLDTNQPPTHFKAHVEDWWRSEDGKQSFYAAPGTLKRSCGPWVSLNPIESTVKAGETLVVRVTVTIPVELRAGGYWCVLTVDEMPDPLAQSAGVGVRFVASVSTGIFVDINPLERAASVLDLQVEGDEASIRIRNEGNTPLGIEGHLEFRTPGAQTTPITVAVDRATILTEPTNEGTLNVALPSPSVLPSGRYIVRAILDFAADHYIGAEREIVITRPSSGDASLR